MQRRQCYMHAVVTFSRLTADDGLLLFHLADNLHTKYPLLRIFAYTR